MKRVLVTGASGFIGSHLVRYLLVHGIDVAILRRAATDLWRLGGIADAVYHVQGDFRDVNSFADTFRAFRPDTVFHFAWSGVGNSHRNDLSQIESNVAASAAFARFCCDQGVQAWIGAGSQAEYGPHDHAIHEKVFPAPTTVYGAAKLATYYLIERIAAIGGMRYAWLRIFSTYGPRDNAGWMIPTLVCTLLRGEKMPLTSGEQQWDYLYVEDAIEAIYRVAVTPAAEGLFNLGSGTVTTIRSVAEQVRDLIDPSLPLGFGEVPFRDYQIMYLKADIRKLTMATGWVPRTQLNEGLRRTIDWHRCQPFLTRPREQRSIPFPQKLP